jgi:exodeoxyribonuclease VII small subunit
MAKTKGIQLENTLSKLEDLTCKLEDDEVNLETALAAFEEGIRLTRSAQKALQAAEQHVQLLLDQNGQPESEPFTSGEPE